MISSAFDNTKMWVGFKIWLTSISVGSFCEKLGWKMSVVLEEGDKESAIVDQINDSTSFSNTVHSKHWATDISSLNASLSCHHGADS